MQNEQDFYPQPGEMDGGYDLLFATQTNVDLFSFPVSGPATAPAYMNAKSFWDPSNSMTETSMDFADPFVASGDWAAEMFQQQQQSTNTPQLQYSSDQSVRKPRPLLARPPTSSMPPAQSGVTFDFRMASLGEHQFAMPSARGVVNPSQPFSYPNTTPPLPCTTFSASSLRSHSQLEIQPQPTLLSPLAIQRSQSAQSERPESIHRPMLRPVSPLKGQRPSIHRPTTDNVKGPPALKPAAPLANDAQPPSNFAGKGRYSSGTGPASFSDGRLSPTKQGSRTNLQAIPESREKLFNPRTAVTFSIDANGRARTETTVIMETYSDSVSRSSGYRLSAETQSALSGSALSGSSTDEETIVIPSRNPSFMHTDTNRANYMPKMARFDSQTKTYPRSGARKLSAGNVKAMSKTTQALEDDSDEDADIDTACRSGDASKALRRVMESRRRSVSGITSMPPASNVSTIRISSSSVVGNGRERDRDRRYRRQSCTASSNTAYSAPTPSTVTDLDVDVEMMECDTASSVASESTRCVCQRREKNDDEFMIQCEACEHWQHSSCVKINPRELPKVYICAFCAQTPNMMGRRGRGRDRERGMDVIPDWEVR